MFNDFIAGVGLAGERLPDGRLRSYRSDAHIWEWPDTVTVGPNTYTLEHVEIGDNGYEYAEYC